MDHPNSPAVRLVTSREWTLDRLLAAGARFQTVDRISANSGTPEQITSTIKDYEQRNVPLVVQDLHHHPAWPEFFTPEWLESNYGSQGTCGPNIFVQLQMQTLASQWLKFAMSTAKGLIWNRRSPSSSTVCATLRSSQIKKVGHITPAPTTTAKIFSRA